LLAALRFPRRFRRVFGALPPIAPVVRHVPRDRGFLCAAWEACVIRAGRRLLGCIATKRFAG
jgi:hypothetical protein